MGEPVEVSPENRAKTRELAAAIVDSVRNDAAMPLGLTDLDIGAQNGCYSIPDVEALVMQLAQEVVALREGADRAAERLLFCTRIYYGYRIGYSRGPNGCIFDAIEATRPDVAADLREGLDDTTVYRKHFPQEDDHG